MRINDSSQQPSPTRLLEMLSDRFGAFEAIANSSIKLARRWHRGRSHPVPLQGRHRSARRRPHGPAARLGTGVLRAVAASSVYVWDLPVRHRRQRRSPPSSATLSPTASSCSSPPSSSKKCLCLSEVLRYNLVPGSEIKFSAGVTICPVTTTQARGRPSTDVERC